MTVRHEARVGDMHADRVRRAGRGARCRADRTPDDCPDGPADDRADDCPSGLQASIPTFAPQLRLPRRQLVIQGRRPHRRIVRQVQGRRAQDERLGLPAAETAV